MKLNGKTAVVTGGSTGIGFATAREFLAEGARVIITGQSEERLNNAVAKLGAGVIGVRADVRVLADLESLAARVEAEFGKLDILFANAGIGHFAPLEQVDESSFDELFDTNVKGVFFTVQKLVSLLNDGASVILNSSAANSKGFSSGSVYNATKAAVRSLARTFAVELGGRGIRVNALSPGLVPTEIMNTAGLPPETFGNYTKIVEQLAPLGRIGKLNEIARVAVFLAGSDSSYITAADIAVDGGAKDV